MANAALPIVGMRTYGRLTATAGTVIQQLIYPFRRAFTRIMQFQYVTAGTAHTITCRQACGITYLSAAAAPSQAVIAIAAQPFALDLVGGANAMNVAPGGASAPVNQAALLTGIAYRTIAANDFLVIERPDGLWDLKKVTSISGLNVTLSTNVPANLITAATGYAANAKVWLMSLDTTDVVPGTNLTNPKIADMGATATTNYPANDDTPVGVFSSPGKYQPLILESNNATNAGVFEYITTVGTAF
jgi:hypothetical protein